MPFQQRAHWQYNRLDAYVAVMAGFEQPEQLEPFVAQQLAAIYVKSLGDVPRDARCEMHGAGTRDAGLPFNGGIDSTISGTGNDPRDLGRWDLMHVSFGLSSE